MSNTPKSKDPFAAREAENYSNPIPSREFILQELEQLGEPVSYETLLTRLQIEGEDAAEGLRRRLIAMSRDGQIISNRRGDFGIVTHMDLQKGRIQGNKDGFGFFIPEDGSGDLFLGTREMENLFDGDIVLARTSGIDNRGRKEGTVVEVLQRRYLEIVGRYYEEQGVGIVVPDSKRIPHEILIPQGMSGHAKDGEFVVAEITQYPERRRKAIARITEVLGDTGTPGVEIDIALRSHDIPHEFPAAVMRQSDGLAEEISTDDLRGRVDLRTIPFVTIDGEDAKDFDDAVFARRNESNNRVTGYTLFVAIADVSHYVQPGSALDEEATNRGTSVYFPGTVIPMLPEKLSNGMCSLKPKEDRLTLVAEMEINPHGEVMDYRFFEAVIHSHARLTYNEVADMVQPATTETAQKLRDKQRERYAGVVSHIDEIYELYKQLHKAREAAGAIDFDTVETRIVFGEDKKIREIVPVHRNDAHRLIEECMLCANVCAARLLEDLDLPALYRTHEGPNPDKLDSLREYLAGMDLFLPGGDDPETGDYQIVLEQIADRPDRNLIQVMLIRSMMQAVYQPDNVGHFGLGFSAYTHFTSPIRRYPDLLVHRGIRYLIRNKKNRHLVRHENAPDLPRPRIYPYEKSDLASLGEKCSLAERRADAASYRVQDWLKCEYMQDKVGEEFTGTVTSVTNFGLFVELNDIYIEGLVHITELSNDYYHFDPVHHCLEGERSRQVYRMGNTVEVRLVRVDMDERKIDLQMVGVTSASPPRKGRGGKKPHQGDKGKSGRGRGKSAGASKKSPAKDKGADGARKPGARGGGQAKAKSKGGDQPQPQGAKKKQGDGKSAPSKPRSKGRGAGKQAAGKPRRSR